MLSNQYYSGTVRSNLDPFAEYNDDKLFEVLTRVGLYNPMKRVPSSSSLSLGDGTAKNSGRAQPIKSLSDEVAEGGKKSFLAVSPHWLFFS